MKVIVILGAAVWENGPSPTLRRRCAQAVKVWQTGGVDAIVVCGGLGQHPPTEAAAMAQLLADQGVPDQAVHQEGASTTTLENLQFAKPILDRLGCQDIVIVTDQYHAPRARLVARTLGLRATVSCPRLRGAHLPTQIRQHIREGIALPAYAIRLAWLKTRKQL